MADIIIQAPDGSTIAFPQGTSEEEMLNAMRRAYPAPTEEEVKAELERTQAEQQDAMAAAFYTAPKEGTLGQRPARRTERERLESEIQALTESRRRRLEEEASPSEQAQQAQAMEGAFYSKPPEMTVEQYFEEQSKALQRAETRSEEARKKKESQEKVEASRREELGPLREVMDELRDPATPWWRKAMLSYSMRPMAQTATAPSVAAVGRKALVEFGAAPFEVFGLGLAAMSPEAANEIFDSWAVTELSKLKERLAGTSEMTSTEEFAADITTLLLGSGFAKSLTKKAVTNYTEAVNKQFGREVAQKVEKNILESTGQRMVVKPKDIPISQKQAKGIERTSQIAAAATGVAIDVQLSDGEQLALDLLSEVPELQPIVETLKINPEDGEAQAKLKKLAESSMIAGGISAVFKSVPAFIRAITSAESKVNGIGSATNNGALTVPPSTPNTVVTQSSLVQTPSGTIEQRNVIVEAIARINTGLGRAFKSSANLPKDIFEAYIEKSNAGRAYELELKRVARSLTSTKKEFKVSDTDFNAYMNNGIDNGLPQQLKSQIDEFRNIVESNEARINQDLGLTGSNALGVGFKDSGEIYITRAFESTDNPAYLKKIRNVLLGRTENTPVDASFIDRVNKARDYLLQQITSDPSSTKAKEFLALSGAEQKAQLDYAIEKMVMNLSGDNKSFIKNIIDGSVQSNNNLVLGSMVKVLKERQDLSKPILDLLGEVKDPVRNAIVTLQNQNRLLAEIEYVLAVEKFANQNSDKVINIGGLLNFLPSVRTKFSSTPFVGAKSLEEVSRQSIGKFGGGSQTLADIFTTPQMADYIASGTNLWNWNGKLGSGIGNVFAKVASAGQSTQTIYDFPAYILNTVGAAQTLAANGHILSKTALKGVLSNVNTLTQQLRANDKNAIQYLQKLKQQGVLDTDITAEVLVRNANILGDTPSNFLSKFYTKITQKLGAAYGQPDNYMKLLAHQSETAALKKMFPNMSPDEIFEEASRRVRDTMPTYGVSAPFARELSKFPFGAYPLYTTEIFRTSKNVIKYAIGDITNGFSNGNGAQLLYGLRRLAGISTVLAGPALYTKLNNQKLGVTDENQRSVDAFSAEWGKGSNKFFLDGFVEGKDGTIKTRYAASSTYESYDPLVTLLRQLTGKILAGKEVKQFEIDDALKTIASSILDPYTDPKFLTEALLNILSGFDVRTGKPIYDTAAKTPMLDNVKAGILELAKAFDPGTFQIIRAYVESLDSEKLRGLYEGVNAAGFPLSSRDIETWAKTGIRPTTVNVDKAIGFNLSKDIKAINLLDDSFTNFVKKTVDQPYSPELGKKIVDEYRKYQDRKFEAMLDLKDKVDLFSSITYKDKDGTVRNYGFGRIVSAITDKGRASTDVPKELEQARGNVFVPDIVAGRQDIRVMILGKSYPTSVLNDIAKVTAELSGKRLVREKKE